VLFRGRHFEDMIIILCVRYSLSYRDLEEMMAERGLSVDHVTVRRWVQHYALILNQRLRRDVRHPKRRRCRPSPYLNNVIEQDHRFIKKRIAASLWFRSAEGALRTIDGYERCM